MAHSNLSIQSYTGISIRTSFYTNLWWCCFNNCLFSSSPWTDCVLPAQQHHGPRPVLCDIFQVSHPNVCPASTRCVQSASPTVGMCRRRLPASSYSEWSPGADEVIGAFCFSLLSDSCFFKTVAFPSLSGMEYAEYSGHHTKTAVSSAEQRRWRLPPFNQSVNFDLESYSVVWSAEEEPQLV